MVIMRFMFHQTTIRRLSGQHMAPIILKLNFVVFSFTHSSLTRCSFNAISVMAIHLLPRKYLCAFVPFLYVSFIPFTNMSPGISIIRTPLIHW